MKKIKRPLRVSKGKGDVFSPSKFSPSYRTKRVYATIEVLGMDQKLVEQVLKAFPNIQLLRVSDTNR